MAETKTPKPRTPRKPKPDAFAETGKIDRAVMEAQVTGHTGIGMASSSLGAGDRSRYSGEMNQFRSAYDKFLVDNPDVDLLRLRNLESRSSSLGLFFVQSQHLYDAQSEMVRKDPAINAAFRSVVAQVLMREMTIRADESEDETVERARELAEECILPHVIHSFEPWLMGALMHGHSELELIWGRKGDYYAPVRMRHAHPGQFAMSDDGRLHLYHASIARSQSEDFIAAHPMKFAQLTKPGLYGNPYGDSLLMSLEFVYFVKKEIIKQMSVFIDKFGTPFADVSIDAPDDLKFQSERDSIRRALAELTRSNGLIHRKQTAITMVSRMSGQSGGVTLFLDAIRYLDEMIILLIRGAILGMLDSEHNARAASEVHADLSAMITKPLARLLEEAVNSQIVAPLLKVNFGAEIARQVRFDIDIDDPVDVEQAIKIIEGAGKKVDLSVSQVRDWMGLQAPESEEDTIPKESPAPPPGIPGFEEDETPDADPLEFITLAEAAEMRGGSRASVGSWIKSMAQKRPDLAPRRFRGRVHKGDFLRMLNELTTAGAADEFDGPMVFSEGDFLQDENTNRVILQRIGETLAADWNPALAEHLRNIVSGTSKEADISADVKLPPDTAKAERAAFVLALAISGRHYARRVETFQEGLGDIDPRFRPAVEWMVARDIVTPNQLQRIIDDLVAAQRTLPIPPREVFERMIRERVLSLKRITDEAITAQIRDSLASAINSGETFQAWREKFLQRVDAGEFPAVGEGYAQNVFRTETSNAYSSQRAAMDAAPEIREFLRGYRILNPDDGRSRDSHAALNGLELRIDGEAWDALGFPPFSYSCRCSAVPILGREPEEPANALDVVLGVERFAEVTAAALLRFEGCGTGAGGFKPGNKCQREGGGGKKSSSKKPLTPKTKSEIAKSSARRVDSEIQRYAEEGNEPQLAKKLGGSSLRNSEPVDIIVAKDGKIRHGIELKTMVDNKANKITMKRSAMEKKAAWEKANKAKFHTVVFDDSKVFNANGKGKHDYSKRRIFYRRGYGSFRVNAMMEVKSVAELQRTMDTPLRSLPESGGGKRRS